MSASERETLKRLYPNSQRWQDKVARMPDSQVTAIYIRFKAEGRLPR